VARTQVSITYQDWRGKVGTFAFLIDSTFAAAPRTELLAALNALRAASQCEITQVVLSDVIDISGLTNGVATGNAGSGLISEQAVLAFRSAVGTDVKLSIPGIVDAAFVQAGGFAGQDIDPTNAAMVTLLGALEDTGLIDKSENAVAFRKGWKRGMPHS